MVIKIEPLFVSVLQKCPKEFQLLFRKIYQQLKVVDKPEEVKGIIPIKGEKGFYKLFIDKSKVGLRWNGKMLHINTFLYCQYLDEEYD